MATQRRAAQSRAALPDLVYPVKVDGECDELRYSLRSVAANASGLYRKVWVVTTAAAALPSWLAGVGVIEAGSQGGRAKDVRAKIAAVCADRRVSSRVVLMNDDYYLVESVDAWRSYHMGPTSEYLRRLSRLPRPLTVSNSSWVRAVASTAEWMRQQGHGDVLCRQGHRPLLWSRSKLAKVLAEYPADRDLDIVGLYDIAGAGGVGQRGGNSKITAEPESFFSKLDELDIPWLSSNNRSFREGMIGGYIRGIFRNPGPYEREAT